jgi:hypothetical protein
MSVRRLDDEQIGERGTAYAMIEVVEIAVRRDAHDLAGVIGQQHGECRCWTKGARSDARRAVHALASALGHRGALKDAGRVRELGDPSGVGRSGYANGDVVQITCLDLDGTAPGRPAQTARSRRFFAGGAAAATLSRV